MGRKKRKVNIDLKPFCYYCDREFDDEKVLIQHQKAKHFKCLQCNRKLDIANGLVVHMLQVHKTNLKSVPNALSKRNDPELIIRGMNGVPSEIIEENLNKLKQKLGDKNIKRQQRVNWAQVAMAPTMEQFLKQAQIGNFVFPGFNSPLIPSNNLLSNSTYFKKSNISSAPLYFPNTLNVMQPSINNNLYASNAQQNISIPNISLHTPANIPPHVPPHIPLNTPPNSIAPPVPTGIPQNIPPPVPPSLSQKYPLNMHLPGPNNPPNLSTNIPQQFSMCIPHVMHQPVPPSIPPTPSINDPEKIGESVPVTACRTQRNVNYNDVTNNNMNKTNGIHPNPPSNKCVNNKNMNNTNSGVLNNTQFYKQNSIDESLNCNNKNTEFIKGELNPSEKEINYSLNNDSTIEMSNKSDIKNGKKQQNSIDMQEKENGHSEYLYNNSISTTIKMSIPPPAPPLLPPAGDLKLNYNETILVNKLKAIKEFQWKDNAE